MILNGSTSPPDFSCQLCGTNSCKVKYPLQPHAVVACAACDLYQLSPRVSTEKLSDLTERAYHGDTYAEISKFRTRSDITDLSDPTVSECVNIIESLESANTGRTLLDIGCGSGDLMAIARNRGWIVHGMDFCPVPVQEANDQYDLDAVCCSFEEYDAEDGAFDAIIMLDVLEHTSSLKEVMVKVIRLLNKGGLIAFSLPNRKSLIYMIAGLLYRTRMPWLQRPILLFYDVVVCHTVFFGPHDANTLCDRYDLELLSIQLKNPDVGRLNLPFFSSTALRLVNGLSSLFGLQSRMVGIARKKLDNT